MEEEKQGELEFQKCKPLPLPLKSPKATNAW